MLLISRISAFFLEQQNKFVSQYLTGGEYPLLTASSHSLTPHTNHQQRHIIRPRQDAGLRQQSSHWPNLVAHRHGLRPSTVGTYPEYVHMYYLPMYGGLTIKN